ncbi:hypothetical protein L3X38_024269 [Prunus dulcis]|uniref:GAG-pre-integrase domain-containing protein n=1 Tax=Prunus dulcis TaxID=3755 RepID=A0AAD4W0B3_PRUDU|nr:hypothetical protein L3X38_024269 [Prunus dulcis]
MCTGEIVPVVRKGTLVIETKLGRKHTQEMMLVAGLEENLRSVGQMICFPLTMMPASDLALKASVTHCLQTWHKRLGHLNERSIKMLENQDMVHGLPHLEQTSVVCEGCMLGKQHRDSFPLESIWRATCPLELVHTDICGPMQTESIPGNRCPSKSLKKVAPFEAYSSKKPGIAHLKIFGSPCHVHIPSALRHKLEENNHKCIFVGYGICEKRYILFDPKSRKIILSRDVHFDEDASWKWENTGAEEIKVSMPTGSQDCELSQTFEPSTQVDGGTTLQDEEILESSQAIDHTPKTWKSINQIMAQCNMCIMEPENFEEADLDES